jgi:predicted O-methyltransferase YrrM
MIPIINLWNENKDNYRELLEDKFKTYITTISSDAMAASLECCMFLLALYDFTKANNILDLGSGFSSYSLRLFKKIKELNTYIVSVDSSKEWLEKSSAFCIENNVDAENFETWNDFKNKDIKFDLMFLDIDYTKHRPGYFSSVFEKYSNPGTLVLCDDLHKNGIRKPLKEYLNKNTFLKQYDIKEQTIDSFGRFSLLVEVK